jgi:hypothetical protein
LALAAGSYAVFEDLRRDFIYLNDTAFSRFGDAGGLQAGVGKPGQLYRIISLANADDMQQAKISSARPCICLPNRGPCQGSTAGLAYQTAVAVKNLCQGSKGRST